MIALTDGDTPAIGHLALPATGSGPGVILLHAWWGLTPWFVQLCDRLAAEGFVALAPDLYHGTTAATIPEAKRLRSQVDREAAHQDMRAAVTYLRQHPAVDRTQLGVVGFSIGAHWALWLAEQHPRAIGAVVLFYGTSGGRFRKTQAAFLGHFAEQDDWGAGTRSVEALAERLQAAGREVAFHTYPGTQHWFAEEDRPDAYQAEAAQAAWGRTLSFLRAHLGQE